MSSAAADLRAFYDSLPAVPCRRLCGAYCGPILVFPIERLRMELAGRGPLVVHLTDRSATCGYFDPAQSACSVHAVRPLICRLFGAVDDPRMRCPFGCVPDRWVTQAEVDTMIDHLRAVSGELDTGELV